jgi:DNA repair exonuclease SbcCD ATPase subunit
MNEKTNIGYGISGVKPQVCCGIGGSAFTAADGWLSWSDATEKIERLRQEKAEIYAALQQSELEANKWRCETEALRKAYTKQTEEYANGDRIEQKYRRAVMEELEETKRKLADAERKLAVSRVEFDSATQAELVYCLQTQNRQLKEHLEANSKGYHEARAELEAAQQKLVEADAACKTYRDEILNNMLSLEELAKLRAKAKCLDRIQGYVASVYANL